MIAVLFFLFFFCIVIGLPIFLSLLFTSTVSLMAFTNTPAIYTIQKIFTSCDSFSLMAIPFFMLSGGLMDKGGVSKRLVDFANSLVGWMPGGLAIVAFLACAFFGAISGSASATVAAIGGIMVPSLLEAGYSLRFSLSTVAAGGFLGIIIPPSIPMVLYAVAGSVSVGDVFTGGFIPGFMLVIGMSVYAFIYGVRHNIPRSKFRLSEVWRTFCRAIWALFMPIIILGGIYGGIFTPTEAAGVACVYGLFVGLVIYRELNFKAIISVIRSSVASTSMIMMIIAAATVFGMVLTREMIPQTITAFIISLAKTRFQFLLLVTALLFVVGMFLDAAPAVMILTPIFIPVLSNYGISPVAFGVIMIINLGIGLVTPPVGMNLYVATTLKKDEQLGVETVINRHLLWYIVGATAVLLILLAFPNIITFLPNLLK